MTARILSAGIVLLHRSRDRYEYLLLRAFSYWDFPKGAVESGEKPLGDKAIQPWSQDCPLLHR
jgi:8-oxo-dGTP pyrophosphatase MutT (NUDIX family)